MPDPGLNCTEWWGGVNVPARVRILVEGPLLVDFFKVRLQSGTLLSECCYGQS